MNPGYLMLKQAAKDLPLYQEGSEPIRAPESIRRASPADAEASLDALIRCFRQIFGGEEWRLGYYCTQEGMARRYTNAEFEKLAAPYCDCGALLARCLKEEEELLRALPEKMRANKGSLALWKDASKLNGFSIGLLVNTQEIPRWAIFDMYNPSACDALQQKRAEAAIERYFSRHQISGEVMYGLSGGLSEDARVGLQPILFLMRALLYDACSLGNKVFLGVTHPGTPMKQIVLALGMEEVFTFSDGSVLMAYHDVEPLLKVTQSLSGEQVKAMMRGNPAATACAR